MTPWRCLFLIYDHIDVSLPGVGRFAHQLSPDEISVAIEAFRQFPNLVEELTDGRAGILHDVVRVRRTLANLTRMGEASWWPSPEDTHTELQQYVFPDRYDSVFVLWPQSDLENEVSIPTGGWGLALGASNWSFGATYAAVANAPTWMWEIPRSGEVWLHEWLHGVCAHFAQQGYVMPDGDADGADRHGYMRSPESGWTGYYRDLMSGQVLDGGRLTGIPLEAWRTAFPERL